MLPLFNNNGTTQLLSNSVDAPNFKYKLYFYDKVSSQLALR